MKIAILADNIDHKINIGQYTYAFNLISGFGKIGVDHTLLYADIPKQTNYKNSPKASYRFLKLPFLNKHLRSRLINSKASKFDILHLLTSGDMPLKCSRAKMVVTLHDVIPFKHPEFYSKHTLSYIIEEIKEIVKVADALITVSEHSKKDIMEIFDYDPARINVIYLGIDPDIFSKKDIPRLVSEEYILYVGGLAPRKGLLYLLKAFRKIKKHLPHQLLLIDSGGWNDKNIYKLISEHDLTDRVFLGTAKTLEEMANYYNHAEMLVFPSLYEGFGLPPLEAMACGCPVLTSANTSLKELYEGYAIMLNPQDIERLAENILELLGNAALRNKLIERGLSLSRRLNQENMARETVNVYERILRD